VSDHDHASPGDPSYDGFRISELWAWTQVDPKDNQEGIITLASPAGPMPMIASDRVRLADLEWYAHMVANEIGREVRLRRFTLAEDVKTIAPAP
jgi:hypothetical protein